MKALRAVPGLVSTTFSDGCDRDDDDDDGDDDSEVGNDGSDNNGGDDDSNSDESKRPRMDIMSFQNQALRLPETLLEAPDGGAQFQTHQERNHSQGLKHRTFRNTAFLIRATGNAVK